MTPEEIGIEDKQLKELSNEIDILKKENKKLGKLFG